jgi:hypothetical protein
MSAKEIHSEAFSARIEAVEALQAAGSEAGLDTARLRNASDQLRVAADLFGLAPNAVVCAAFADLTHLVALLGEWRSTVLNAGVDAQRFLTAAKERAGAWLASNGSNASLETLSAVVRDVAAVHSIGEVPSLAAKLGSVPLPIGIYAIPTRDTLRVEMGVGDALQDAPKNGPPPELERNPIMLKRSRSF